MSSPTNAIRFELSPLVAPRFGIGVEIRIDGVSLIDVIRAILIDTIRRLESPWWASRSLPQPAAPYIRVPAKMACGRIGIFWGVRRRVVRRIGPMVRLARSGLNIDCCLTHPQWR